MKVGLIVAFWPTEGPDSGIAKNYHRLACALAARGHQVTVFHINTNQPFWKVSRLSREQGFSVIELPCRVMPNRNWKGWLPLAHAVALARLYFKLRQLPGLELEVMETTSYGGFSSLYYHLLWRGKPPLLIRVSTTGEQMRSFNDDKSLGGYSRRLEDKLIQSASNLCTHTEVHRGLICAQFGMDPARIEVVPHGIDLPSLSALRPAGEKTVLYAGRFEWRKGTDSLLQAIPLVLARPPDCRFDLAGEGTMYKIWREAFLRKHGDLAGQVRFLGRIPDEKLEELYQNCDFFVAPALYESFGMVYLEAMRYSKPVIGCLNSGGAAEVIGEGGLLVPQRDAEQLAEAIIRLWTDRKLHQELSVRARLRAEYYSMDRKAERTEKVYARLIATGEACARANPGGRLNPSQ